MTNSERMKMLMLAVKDLNEAVGVYEKVKAEDKNVWGGINVPKHYSKEAIKRRITQIRQDLLILGEGL